MIQGVFQSFSDAPGGFEEELHELMYSVGGEYWYDDQFENIPVNSLIQKKWFVK